MLSRKDSFISKSTYYITLYSTLTLSYQLVICATAAAYAKNKILSVIEATGYLSHTSANHMIVNGSLGECQDVGSSESKGGQIQGCTELI